MLILGKPSNIFWELFPLEGNPPPFVEELKRVEEKGHLNLFLAHPAILGKAISSKGTNQWSPPNLQVGQIYHGSYCIADKDWMEERVTSGLAMKRPMTMSNPEIGLLAKHTCKRLVRVEKKYCLNVNCSTGVHVPLRTWLNMKNVFQPKVNGSCYLNLSNAS